MNVCRGLMVIGWMGAAALPLAPACGGSHEDSGGGSPDAGTDGNTVISDPEPDHSTPTIVSLTPTDGDQQVSVRAPIQVKFSKRMVLGASPATVLVGATTVTNTATLSSDEQTMTITPKAPIFAPAKVTVTLGDVTDRRDTPLASKISWSWAAPPWLTVGSELSGGSSYGSTPAIAAAQQPTPTRSGQRTLPMLDLSRQS